MLKKIQKILLLLGVGIALIAMPAFGAQKKYATLRFYTVDGAEITALKKKVDTSTEYTFKNPDEYKYETYKEDGVVKSYNELFDQVTGICWEEENETFEKAYEQYTNGQAAKFSEGEHYFRVKTDHPELTEEDVMFVSTKNLVSLRFFTVDYDEIEELACSFDSSKKYTLPDPSKYTHLSDIESDDTENDDTTFEEEFDDEYEDDFDMDEEYEDDYNDDYNKGSGIFWRYEDYNGIPHLLGGGVEEKFSPGSYDLIVMTDNPITITYRYPCDDMVIEAEPFTIYYQTTALAGDQITLLGSPGAIVWGADFVGWQDMLTDTVYNKKARRTVSDNSENWTFMAVYEYNDDWDPNAPDENAALFDGKQVTTNIIATSETVNKSAGVGYNAYINSSGTLVGNERSVTALPVKTKQDKKLSSIIDPEGDPNDVSNYARDVFGRKVTEENQPQYINEVLKQNDSAMVMDVYGNSFTYDKKLSRLDNMCQAYLRLSIWKSEGWAQLASFWDENTIAKYEAIEFALLAQEYPKEGSIYNRFNSETDSEVLTAKKKAGIPENAKIPEWKNEYVSEKAFKQMAKYKTMWQGWGEYGDDANTGDGSNTVIVKTSSAIDVIKDGISNVFGMTAYAASKNGLAEVSPLRARTITSLDNDEITHYIQYYDAALKDNFHGFSINTAGLKEAGLDDEGIATLKAIIDHFLAKGYSKEAVAGICGNLWQESLGFHAGITNPAGTAYGLVQWMNGRKDKLIAKATEMDLEWKDVEAQLAYLDMELHESYEADINKELTALEGVDTNMATVNNVQSACDAWCAIFEGCTCGPSSGGLHASHKNSHNELCKSTFDYRFGRQVSYQHLGQRREYAEIVYKFLNIYNTFGVLGGSLKDYPQSEIVALLFPDTPGGRAGNISLAYSEAEVRSVMEDVPVTLGNGRQAKITVHQAIAQDVKKALEEMAANGLNIVQLGGFDYRGTHGANGYNGVKTGHDSFHLSGLAVDINWDQNPQVFTSSSVVNETDYQKKAQMALNHGYNPIDPTRKTLTIVDAIIMKANGLLWGRDFSGNMDFMHFSIGEVSQDGRNQQVSLILEQTEADSLVR